MFSLALSSTCNCHVSNFSSGALIVEFLSNLMNHIERSVFQLVPLKDLGKQFIISNDSQNPTIIGRNNLPILESLGFQFSDDKALECFVDNGVVSIVVV